MSITAKPCAWRCSRGHTCFFDHLCDPADDGGDTYHQERNLTLQGAENLVSKTLTKLAHFPVEVRWFGDPILRQVALPFGQDELRDGTAQDVSDQLVSILKKIQARLGFGRAIAAPQIGISRRAFLDYNNETDNYVVYFNPVIVATSRENSTFREMCFSGMPLAGTVIRPRDIELEYHDIHGRLQRLAADPVLSRIIQHEVDHLDGILFVDRADPRTLAFEFDWPRFMAANKLF